MWLTLCFTTSALRSRSRGRDLTWGFQACTEPWSEKQLFLPEMAQQNSFELGEMARFSKEKIVLNPSTVEVNNKKWEIIDPFYLQDKAESSQDFKPLFFFFFLCSKAKLNLSIQTRVICPASMLLLIYQLLSLFVIFTFLSLTSSLWCLYLNC